MGWKLVDFPPAKAGKMKGLPNLVELERNKLKKI